MKYYSNVKQNLTFPTKTAARMHFLAFLLLCVLVLVPELPEFVRRHGPGEFEGPHHVARVATLFWGQECPRVALVARTTRATTSRQIGWILVRKIRYENCLQKYEIYMCFSSAQWMKHLFKKYIIHEGLDTTDECAEI